MGKIPYIIKIKLFKTEKSYVENNCKLALMEVIELLKKDFKLNKKEIKNSINWLKNNYNINGDK